VTAKKLERKQPDPGRTFSANGCCFGHFRSLHVSQAKENSGKEPSVQTDGGSTPGICRVQATATQCRQTTFHRFHYSTQHGIFTSLPKSPTTSAQSMAVFSHRHTVQFNMYCLAKRLQSLSGDGRAAEMMTQTDVNKLEIETAPCTKAAQ
jgi:hypothetical protein